MNSVTAHAPDKGPFKGKGALALDLTAFDEISDWRELVTAFRNLKDAQDRLGRLTTFRERLRVIATSVVDSFSHSYPSARLRLCRSPDRANTYLRWRHSSRKLNMARTELDSPEAEKIIGQLPPQVARDWFRYEEYRLQVNYYMALVVYEYHRTSDHVERLVALRKLRKTHSLKAPPKSRDKS